MGKNDKLLVVGVILLLAFAGGYIKLSGQAGSTVGGADTATVQQTGLGYATTLQGYARNPINSSGAYINMELREAGGSKVVTETAVPGALTSLSTAAANTFNGYIMAGNDDKESTTDRGLDMYYVKRDISWVSKSPVTVDDITVLPESTITWTGFDLNAAETVLNATVGTTEYLDIKLRMTASSGAFGNPTLPQSVAVCFNASTDATGTKSVFEYIKPMANYREIDVPGFMTGENIIGGKCYVLTDIDALIDDPSATSSTARQPTFYEFGIRIKPSSNPATTVDPIDVIALDQTYYLNDDEKWVYGFGDESSAQGEDKDVGVLNLANTKNLWIA
jgi:hypothetical protein